MNNVENIKIAVALRMSRAALGISQLELAEILGVSKITLARVETLESPLRADVYMKAINVLRELGVAVDVMTPNALMINVHQPALEKALARLRDDSKRRVDRKIK
jgi:transcriptional regulator with XRE-family HTH domain